MLSANYSLAVCFMEAKICIIYSGVDKRFGKVLLMKKQLPLPGDIELPQLIEGKCLFHHVEV